jgi:hypothetical protein
MPRTLIGGLAAIVVAFVATPAIGQSTKYWPQHEIGFPVPQQVLDLSPKPVKLRLYAATPNGRFEKVKELPIDRLEEIPNRRPGFQYSTRADGEEEFAVQLVYADGSASPNERDLKPEFRVIFDTRPPAVTLDPLGNFGVQWKISDDNGDATAIRLECRWQNGSDKWHEVRMARSFALKDDYTWASLKQDNRTLEVRVVAKDKAGHESVSRTVRLPDTTGNNGRRDFADEPRNGNSVSEPRNSRSGDDAALASSQIVYVNRRDLSVKSKLTHITRSGVNKVHLYVKELSTSGEWKFEKTLDCNIAFEAADTTVEIPYTAAKDGRYGFIVIPESGVGRREPAPRATTPPQHFVEVDTVQPRVKIRTITVTNGNVGPRVEIEWDADDPNLMPDPIVLEYAADKSAVQWQSIAEKIPNARRYVWEVADKSMFKLYVRARATDKATNVGENIYGDAVIIDLDKPSATIENIRGTGTGGFTAPRSNPLPSVAPERPAPSPSPSPSPSLPPVGLPSVGAPALLPEK